MEKLLHERLRELETNERCMVKNIVGLDECPSISCRKCELHMLNVIADEIERYYIPRPRFEDGKPVKFGDNIEAKGRIGVVENFDYPCDGACVLRTDNNDRLSVWYSKGKFVKRPTPKVYDADGAEIEVGDTVYRESDGEKLTVKSVFADSVCGGCFASEEFGIGYVAKYFTHERPVFDVNEERICEGDTIYSIESGEAFVVEALSSNDYHDMMIRDKFGTVCRGTGKLYTHREPDSLEKLRDDMVITHDAADEPCSTTEEWIDRLTALIERGA